MGIAVLTSYKVDLRARKIIKDREGHSLVIKGSIRHKDIVILNVYTKQDSYKVCEAKTDKIEREKFLNLQL